MSDIEGPVPPIKFPEGWRDEAYWESTRAEWEPLGYSYGKSCLPWITDCHTKDLVRLREDGVYESLEGVETIPAEQAKKMNFTPVKFEKL